MKQIVFSAVFLSALFFSCQSDNVSVMQPLQQTPDEISRITLTQNEMLLPEATSEIGQFETAVFIKTEIQKANIYLNNIYHGKSPLEITGILPGYYTLSVEFNQGQDSVLIKNFIIEIKTGERQNYYIESR